MGTTVSDLRTTYVNGYLQRVEGGSQPWTDTQVNQHITDALTMLWPDVGLRASGTVAADSNTDIYAIPAGITRVSRIALEYVASGITQLVDRISNWRYEDDTHVRIHPRIATLSGLSLRFYGYGPFAADASDLDAVLEPVVAERAAALAYGVLASSLANSQKQQGLDSGRVVGYDTAVGLSAYWERRYQDGLGRYTGKVSQAPHAARR